MRYFIAKNGSTVVDKQAIEGADADINVMVARYQANHPTLVVIELDQATFDATPCTLPQNVSQIAWATLKASSPTALQAITFIARYLGLE